MEKTKAANAIYRTGKTIIALILFFGLLGVGVPARGEQEPQSLMGRLWLHQMEGEVLVRVEGHDEWAAASINFPLQKGDQLATSEGAWAQVNHFGGSTITLSENTWVEIDEFRKQDSQDQLRLALSRGRLDAVITGEAASTLMVDVETPNLSVQATPATTLQVEAMEEARSTRVAVPRGEAVIQTQGTTSRLAAGRSMTVREDGSSETGAVSYVEGSYPRAETDSSASSRYSPSAGYVPEPLQPYSSELDQYGYWTSEPEYGTVWVPSAVPVDWAPFTYGRWVYRYPSYVWISYWPWGWVPFHYGRWAFRGGIGWFWVPPPWGHVYWCPGAVGWWQTSSSYVYWVPLAPWEIYYGFGYYGPWSVNIGIFYHDHRHFVRHFHHDRHKFHGLKHHGFRNAAHRGAVSGLSMHAFLGRSHEEASTRKLFDARAIHQASTVPQPVVAPGPQTLVPHPFKRVRAQDVPAERSTWSGAWRQKRKSPGLGQASIQPTPQPLQGTSSLQRRSMTGNIGPTTEKRTLHREWQSRPGSAGSSQTGVITESTGPVENRVVPSPSWRRQPGGSTGIQVSPGNTPERGRTSPGGSLSAPRRMPYYAPSAPRSAPGVSRSYPSPQPFSTQQRSWSSPPQGRSGFTRMHPSGSGSSTASSLRGRTFGPSGAPSIPSVRSNTGGRFMLRSPSHTAPGKGMSPGRGMMRTR